MTDTFQAHAPAIQCEGCASAIKRALSSLPGVSQVAVDIPGKNVTVAYDTAQVGDKNIRARLDKAGFPAE